MKNQIELPLEGTPDMVIECVMNLVRALANEGNLYKCVPKIGDAPNGARWDRTYSARCDVFVTRQSLTRNDEDVKIGTVELRLLPNNRTLLGVQKPQHWDGPLGHFLGYLLREFKRLGFAHFEEEKPPIGFSLPHKEKNV